jgi:small conductance mechanosensitive channel
MEAYSLPFAQTSAWQPWLDNPWVRIAIIIVLSYALLHAGRALVRRFVSLSLRFASDDPVGRLTVEKRRTTIQRLLNSVLGILIVSGAVLMVGDELKFDIVPLIASAGLAGLAIGFGAQTLVKDLINGAFIIFENQFNVGDVIKAADRDGLVEEINLRTTVLRDLSGTVHIIPNSAITTVSVLTKGWSRLVLDVDVAYREDVDRVTSVLAGVLEEYAAENKNAVLEPPQILGVEKLGDSSVTIRALVKTVPAKQWEAGRALRKLVKAKFDAEGIEIPFPQRSVWFRSEAGVELAAPVKQT